jgi:hypothetical protein
MKRFTIYLAVLVFVTALFWQQTGSAQSAGSSNSTAGSPQSLPSIDGGVGPCSVIFTVRADSKPVVAADVKVHIEYGFAGIRRLDLEAYTGNDGKVKFTGLPSRVHNPPLQFQAAKDDLRGTAVYNPDSECKAEHEIDLMRQKPAQN